MITLTCPNCFKSRTVKRFRTGNFCNYQCFSEYETKEYIKEWIDNKINGVYDTADSTKLHKRIIRWFKQNIFNCEICGIKDEWNNKKLVFEIDHINGKRYDNFRKNLRYICPNCHSQTETFRVKNSKFKKNGPIA